MDFLTQAEWSILLLSLRVSLTSIALMLVPCVLLAWLLARREFPGKVIIELLVHLPLILPPVAAGYLLLLLLGRRGLLGGILHTGLGVDIAFTTFAAAIASAIMGAPLLIRTLRIAIESVDAHLEDAARVVGAGPLRVFLTITLPLASHGLIAGVVLAFARSLGEFGATITFAGNIEGVSRTLPVAIYTYMQVPNADAAALRLVLISLIISIGALAASGLISRRMQASRSESA